MKPDSALITLNIDSSNTTLIDDLKNIESEEFHFSKKRGIDGGTAIVIVLIVARYIMPHVKEILLEYIKHSKIGQLKIDDIEIKNIKESTVKELFDKATK